MTIFKVECELKLEPEDPVPDPNDNDLLQQDQDKEGQSGPKFCLLKILKVIGNIKIKLHKKLFSSQRNKRQRTSLPDLIRIKTILQ